MKECSPAVRRIAVIFDPANPSWPAYLRTIEAAAPSFKVLLRPAAVRDAQLGFRPVSQNLRPSLVAGLSCSQAR